MRNLVLAFFFGMFLCAMWFALEWLFTGATEEAMAPNQPMQWDVTWRDEPWDHNGYHFTPLAKYEIKARVLHRENYFLDRSAAISSLDLALGWGRMSDPRVYDKLWITQGHRFYGWFSFSQPPIPPEEITRSSANTHLIFATPEVASACFWMRADDVVKLGGYLVSVTGPGDFTWNSSLTREDSGNGACEVLWVKDAKVVGR